MKIAVFAPTNTSLYSRLVTHLSILEPGIQVEYLIVRQIWSWHRLRTEARRDGPRLIKKIVDKLILKENPGQEIQTNTLYDYAQSLDLPGTSLSHLAESNNIPILTVPDHNHPKSIATLEEIQPDLIVFTGGGLIRKSILDIPHIGILNCHAGILPPYRGMDVVEWPLLNPKEPSPQIGLTLHLMERGVDTGPILMRHPIPIYPGDSFQTIRTRLEPEMVKLIILGLKNLRDGTISPTPQSLREGKQYFVMHPRLKSIAEKKLEKFSANKSENP